MLDSVIRTNKDYYPQTLLEERKYELKNNKMENHINDEFGASSSDECDGEPDTEPDNESHNKSEKSFKKSDKESHNEFEKHFKKSDKLAD